MVNFIFRVIPDRLLQRFQRRLVFAEFAVGIGQFVVGDDKIERVFFRVIPLEQVQGFLSKADRLRKVFFAVINLAEVVIGLDQHVRRFG
jgi:hypothetical protein